MIDNPVHSLTFGDLTWVEEGANPPDSSGVVYRVRPQDASFGTAIPITTALLWLGRAGAPVSWDSTPNREPVFRVTVEADDSNLLAMGEKALQLQCEQPTTLTWTPPDGAGEPSVFDIVWSHLEPVFDRDGLTGVGMEEAVLRSRTYLVRMQALPYARGADLVVTPAEATTGVETVVFDGTNTTNWVGTDGTPTGFSVVSGALRYSYTGPSSHIIRRNASVSMVGQSYLAFIWKASAPVEFVGFAGQEVARGDAGGGYTISYVKPSDDSSSLSFVTMSWSSPSSGATTMDIDKISTWTALPYFGTARQKAMSLTPGGSVRTQGSIHVTHASASLGKVIVYTHPSGTGYLPPLRQWRTSGNTVTTDSTLNSGAREPIGASSTVFRVPVPVLPTGRVELWAWLRVTSGSLTRAPAYAIRSIVNGVTLASSGGNFSTVFTALNTWQLFCLGALTTPPIAMGPSGLVQIDLNENSGQVELDEAYLFATDEGSLTVVDCSTGTASAGGPSRHLWIDAPTPDVPMGAIYRGHTSDRSDAFHAGSATYSTVWGDHAFDPRGTSVFVVTPNTIDAATSLEHYRRYNTFATRED